MAARVLTEHLNLFVNLCDETGETEIMVDNDDQGREKALEMTIEELDLSVRSFKLPSSVPASTRLVTSSARARTR